MCVSGLHSLKVDDVGGYAFAANVPSRRDWANPFDNSHQHRRNFF